MLNHKFAMVAVVAMTLSACGGGHPGTLSDRAPNRTDGSVIWHRAGAYEAHDGMPAVPAAVWSPAQFRDIKQAERNCDADEAQYPSKTGAALKLGGELLLATGGGAFFGGLLGGIASFGKAIQPVKQATFTGVASGGAAAGSGLVGGLNQEHSARNIARQGCLAAEASWAKTGQHLTGITPIAWAGITDARGLVKPTNAPAPSIAVRASSEAGEEHQEAAAAATPH